jgi:L-rhamnose mutarotase
MQRICFRLQVRLDRLDEYVARHAAVWPEMRAALRDTGWHDYSLYLDRRDGTLIGVFSTPDLGATLAGMAEREVNVRWQAEMAQFFEGTDGRAPDQAFICLDEIFRLDDTTAAPA